MAEVGMLNIAVAKVKYALDDAKLEADDALVVNEALKLAKGNTINLDITKMPVALLKTLLDKGDLTINQRKALFLSVAGITGKDEDILNSEVTNPKDFFNAMVALGGGKAEGPNCEFHLNGRWYPIHFNATYQAASEWMGGGCIIGSVAKICDLVWSESFIIRDADFEDDEGKPIAYTTVGLMNKLNLRPLQTNMQAFLKQVRNAERLNKETGKVLSVTGPAVFKNEYSWWHKIEGKPFGSFAHPRTVVVESELELTQNNGYYGNQGQPTALPFIRIFSLEEKKYIYVDVEDVEDYSFDIKAIEKLVLPTSIETLLKKIFSADINKLFGDVVQGKHGGMVMLANGNSGVGKTLTAECFAQMTKRPLYTLELGELGTSLQEVEKNLQRVFLRATRWNALLLFDEADIFMAKRDANLERSAIVGVFLRLLDYYPGLLFLTTNRAEVIDPAFASRITVRLDYPDLDEAARRKIWEIMLGHAKVKVKDGIDGIPTLPLNGRNIRNLVRLVTVLYPPGEDSFSTVTAEEVKDVCKFAPR